MLEAAGPQAARLAAADDPARMLTAAAAAGDHLTVRDVLGARLERVTLPERRGGPLLLEWAGWPPAEVEL
jgi:hypothetical protein